MNQIDLTGRRAAITGGAQGIGRAVAERLLASGASVALWDRDEKLAQSTAAELSIRTTVHAIAADVSVASDVEAAASATVELFGGIDILVASAGSQDRTRSCGSTPWRHGAR
jgi:3-oxoacyl-[acyl-carrier protein] reductase